MVVLPGEAAWRESDCLDWRLAGCARIDEELVEEVNRGRMIGSEEQDADVAFKVGVMERMIHRIDRAITVMPLQERFPSPDSLVALKSLDVVVACVDRFDVRAQINIDLRDRKVVGEVEVKALPVLHHSHVSNPVQSVRRDRHARRDPRSAARGRASTRVGVEREWRGARCDFRQPWTRALTWTACEGTRSGRLCEPPATRQALLVLLPPARLACV